MLTPEESRQRLLARLDDDAFPNPLPKLRLCCPKLFAVAADHQRCFLLTLFLHLDTPRPLRVVVTQKPVGEASLARQHSIVNLSGANRIPHTRITVKLINDKSSCSRSLMTISLDSTDHLPGSFGFRECCVG